jgi:heme exporter protein A
MLTATDLSCHRGQTRILAGVSFSLAPGDCLILRGPNGAGKTTLLRTLAGLSPALVGTVTAAPDAIVYAGHLDAVKPQLSVAENLNFWRGIYQSKITDALTAFDLVDLAQRPASSLSAGQKRRLGLARLYISGRKIWLLDEPTTALDTTQVAAFVAHIQSHCAQGGIAVISTHLDLPLALAQTLDITQFRPTGQHSADPFLHGFA